MPFEEEGLPELFSDAVEKGIEFTTEYRKTSMYVIADPPPRAERVRNPCGIVPVRIRAFAGGKRQAGAAGFRKPREEQK